MPDDRDEFIPTRTSLLSRLKNWDDQGSWQEFFDTYWKMLYSVATRSGLSDAEAQDIVQEAIVSVAKKMPEFKYDPSIGSFKSWLMLIARRRIIDHFRKRGREPQREEHPHTETARTAVMDKVPDPAGQFDTVWEDEWQKNVLAAAIAKVKEKVEPKQFQIFDCYALKGWPVAEVARGLKVTPDQVYTAKHRIAAAIKAEIKRLEQQMV